MTVGNPILPQLYSPFLKNKTKHELTQWAKSILTHYFMEIFDQAIIKKNCFALLISTSNWGTYLTSVDCSINSITEKGGMDYITESS